jgi:hypothetical protein
MFLKVHHYPGAGDVVAVCDRELLNSTLNYGDVEIQISEAFYGSTPATKEEVSAAIRTGSNVNLIGEQSVAIAIDAGLISRDGCIMIGDIPHAQIFRL